MAPTNCKNCEIQLEPSVNYCSDCGAKVIRNRLTIKNLFDHFAEQFFNYDNALFITMVHLITKPEEVIEGYIKGIRKKYINPISYLGIAITLTGLVIYILQKFYFDTAINMDPFGTGLEQKGSEQMVNIIFDFQALVFILFIPIMAIAGWLAFDVKKYNFAERSVVFSYAMSQYSIFAFPISICTLLFKSDWYMNLSFVMLPIMLGYVIYVIQRIIKADALTFLAKAFVFSILFFVQYFGTFLLIGILSLIFGQSSLADFGPTAVD